MGSTRNDPELGDTRPAEELGPDQQFELDELDSAFGESGESADSGVFSSEYKFGDRLDDGVDEESLSRKDRILHCFRCHREDRHFHGMRSRWYYNILLGFSLGTLNVIGPFRCRCCGGWRLMCHDLLSPRFWLQSLQSGSSATSRRYK